MPDTDTLYLVQKITHRQSNVRCEFVTLVFSEQVERYEKYYGDHFKQAATWMFNDTFDGWNPDYTKYFSKTKTEALEKYMPHAEKQLAIYQRAVDKMKNSIDALKKEIAEEELNG